MRVRSIAGVAGALFASLAAAEAAATDEALWALLGSGGRVVLVRHAVTTPGAGDPPGMRLDDCRTQRNLTDQGRRHGAFLYSGPKYDGH